MKVKRKKLSQLELERFVNELYAKAKIRSFLSDLEAVDRLQRFSDLSSEFGVSFSKDEYKRIFNDIQYSAFYELQERSEDSIEELPGDEDENPGFLLDERKKYIKHLVEERESEKRLEERNALETECSIDSPTQNEANEDKRTFIDFLAPVIFDLVGKSNPSIVGVYHLCCRKGLSPKAAAKELELTEGRVSQIKSEIVEVFTKHYPKIANDRKKFQEASRIITQFYVRKLKIDDPETVRKLTAVLTGAAVFFVALISQATEIFTSDELIENIARGTKSTSLWQGFKDRYINKINILLSLATIIVLSPAIYELLSHRPHIKPSQGNITDPATGSDENNPQNLFKNENDSGAVDVMNGVEYLSLQIEQTFGKEKYKNVFVINGIPPDYTRVVVYEITNRNKINATHLDMSAEAYLVPAIGNSKIPISTMILTADGENTNTKAIATESSGAEPKKTMIVIGSTMQIEPGSVIEGTFNVDYEIGNIRKKQSRTFEIKEPGAFLWAGESEMSRYGDKLNRNSVIIASKGGTANIEISTYPEEILVGCLSKPSNLPTKEGCKKTIPDMSFITADIVTTTDGGGVMDGFIRILEIETKQLLNRNLAQSNKENEPIAQCDLAANILGVESCEGVVQAVPEQGKLLLLDEKGGFFLSDLDGGIENEDKWIIAFVSESKGRKWFAKANVNIENNDLTRLSIKSENESEKTVSCKTTNRAGFTEGYCLPIQLSAYRIDDDTWIGSYQLSGIVYPRQKMKENYKGALALIRFCKFEEGWKPCSKKSGTQYWEKIAERSEIFNSSCKKSNCSL
ncbi:MAG: hypothetical protein WC457_02355 [Patescibacteria group bacterium]